MTLDDAIVLVASYVDTCDWLEVKRELLTMLPNEIRSQFSRRDPYTKKQVINEYEAIIIDKWESLTGIRLSIPDDKRA